MNKDKREGLIGFLVFSVIIFMIGLALGAFKHDPAEDGWIEVIHHPPSGERRY